MTVTTITIRRVIVIAVLLTAGITLNTGYSLEIDWSCRSSVRAFIATNKRLTIQIIILEFVVAIRSGNALHLAPR